MAHLPIGRIEAAYAAAPGDELGSGKLASPASSAALVANSFGFFLDRPADLPPLLAGAGSSWCPNSVELEGIVRFPWRGGSHPCLDVVVRTPGQLVGIESKRYEPFRCKPTPELSDAYWRAVWGEQMGGYAGVRDALRDGTLGFRHLDAAQLVKHAFGLRTEASRGASVRPVLFYLHAEPARWPDGHAVDLGAMAAHRGEIERFAERVAGDEVRFVAATYAQVLSSWEASPVSAVGAHAAAVRQRFGL